MSAHLHEIERSDADPKIPYVYRNKTPAVVGPYRGLYVAWPPKGPPLGTFDSLSGALAVLRTAGVVVRPAPPPMAWALPFGLGAVIGLVVAFALAWAAL